MEEMLCYSDLLNNVWITIWEVSLQFSFHTQLNLFIFLFSVIKDELCHSFMKKHCTDISMCLSSIKHIMSLEKPNSVWLIPVNINTGNNLYHCYENYKNN